MVFKISRQSSATPLGVQRSISFHPTARLISTPKLRSSLMREYALMLDEMMKMEGLQEGGLVTLTVRCANAQL